MTKYQRYYRRHQKDLKYRARRSAHSIKWAKKNKKRKASINKRYYQKLRHDAIMAYGGYQCACAGCDVKIDEFLALNHINGGGRKHRALAGHHNFYLWLKKQGYPAGLNVMCHNCNSARGFYGHCPHELA